MKNRAELEQFILSKLAEIRKEYIDYISQYPEILSRWDNKTHHLSMSIFDHSSDVTGLVVSNKHEDNKRYNTYTISADSLYKFKLPNDIFVDEISEDELRKELNYGKDNTEE